MLSPVPDTTTNAGRGSSNVQDGVKETRMGVRRTGMVDSWARPRSQSGFVQVSSERGGRPFFGRSAKPDSKFPDFNTIVSMPFRSHADTALITTFFLRPGSSPPATQFRVSSFYACSVFQWHKANSEKTRSLLYLKIQLAATQFGTRPSKS